MIGISTDPIAHQLGVNLRAALFGVLQFLDHHHPGAFAHDKTIAAAVEGAGRAFRLIIPGGKSLHIAKTGIPHGQDGGFRAPAEEGIGIAEFDHAPGFPDIVIAGGTGRHDHHVGTMQAMLHADDAAADVADHHRDGERTDPVRPLREEIGVLLLMGGQPTDATADHDAETGGIDLAEIHPGIIQGHFGGSHSEPGIPVAALAILGHFEKRDVIEILHFSPDLAGISGGIKLRDLAHPAFSGDEVFPKGFDIISYRGNDAHTSDDNAAFGHGVAGAEG